MDLARLLTEAVGSWLNFEWCCDRSGLFNEKYLSVPIGQLLASRHQAVVRAEFNHPVIAPAMKGPGRRPQVDFAVCDPYPSVKVAVETKWIGKGRINVTDIIWDLIRLELIAYSSDAQCVFLLAGKRRDLIKLFNSSDFAGPRDAPYRRPILNVGNNSLHDLWLVPRDNYRVDLLRSLFESLQDKQLPQKIVTRRTSPFPTGDRSKQFQVYAWLVQCARKRQTFSPGATPRYRILKPNKDVSLQN
jgi:hypothetical protein